MEAADSGDSSILHCEGRAEVGCVRWSSLVNICPHFQQVSNMDIGEGQETPPWNQQMLNINYKKFQLQISKKPKKLLAWLLCGWGPGVSHGKKDVLAWKGSPKGFPPSGLRTGTRRPCERLTEGHNKAGQGLPEDMRRAGRDAHAGWELGASFHLIFPGFMPLGDISYTSSGKISTSELQQCLLKEMSQEANSCQSSLRGKVLQGAKPRQDCAARWEKPMC